MNFYADLHVHSKYSRATSRDCDLEHLAFWALKKGIQVVATGDFTHPVWREELKTKLIPAEPGLFRLKPEIEKEVTSWLPTSCQGVVRFMLEVEISTIYKKGDKTRKIHHLVYAPDFDAVDKMVSRLDKIGNLNSDGRPILGLDSRNLLEIVLDSSPDSYLVPAHIWTPWFAALGSKSGFDSIEACYGDLAAHIFAVETGLSSDPPMNWRVSSLDRYRLVSNSDAHSPPKLGREACTFATDMNYFAIKRALETGEGYLGTVEFFPEEGKYHMDGHRNCEVRLSPEETKARGGICPVCKRPLTVGVMHRVDDLADRKEPEPPETAGEISSLVPLPEIISEIEGVGPNSKRVAKTYEELIRSVGPEFYILEKAPLEDLEKSSSSLFSEGIRRLRNGEVSREAGYDGEYGVIRVFETDEHSKKDSAPLLFEVPKKKKAAKKPTKKLNKTQKEKTKTQPVAAAPNLLDRQQQLAVDVKAGPLLIVAGPGSGKTRTLTARIARLIKDKVAKPENCLAITFTRKAAAELRDRLQELLPKSSQKVSVHTFHSFGYSILNEQAAAAGLHSDFRVADEDEALNVIKETEQISERKARALLKSFRQAEKGGEAFERYRAALAVQNLVDFDDLIRRPTELLEADKELQELYQRRYSWLFIDEYQDIDASQYQLVRLLAPTESNICVVGDSNQAIYGFRGADVRFFKRFETDYHGAKKITLKHNYRSGNFIVTAASQVITSINDQQLAKAAVLDEPQKITFHQSTTAAAEAEFVVHTLEKLIGGHSFFSLDSGRASGADDVDISFSDIAVLYRTEAQAKTLTQALTRSGIPFQCRSHRALTADTAVQALLSELRQTTESGKTPELLRKAAEKIQQDLPDEGDTFTAQDIETSCKTLLPIAEDYKENLAGFLSHLAMGVDVDILDRDVDRVMLLTLHAAKGMEFPIVFITGCEDSLLPLYFGGQKPDNLDEERRLFYVGITRAQHRLYLSWAKKRQVHGKLEDRQPSPFLKDIEEALLVRSQSSYRKQSTTKNDQLGLF